MQKYSIVPEIINSRIMKFFGEDGVEIKLCESSPFRFLSPFQSPFVRYDSFAKKTTKPHELVFINIDELAKWGLGLFSVKLPKAKKWFFRQKVMHVIASSSQSYPGASRVFNIAGLKLQKDKSTNSVRLVGISAGYPHLEEEGGSSPWIKIPEEKQ